MAKVEGVTEASLRKHGYLTVDEFVDALVPGLKEFLKSNGAIGDLSHPEDLSSGASIYIETMCNVFSCYGVNHETVKKTIG